MKVRFTIAEKMASERNQISEKLRHKLVNQWECKQHNDRKK